MSEPTRLSPPRRPLLGIALLFLVGAYLGWSVVPWMLPAVLVTGLSLVLGWRGPLPIRTPAIWCAVLGTGWLHTAAAQSIGRWCGPEAIMRRPAEHMAVRGVVVDDPVLRPAQRGPARLTFALKLEAVNRDGTWRAVRGRARCTMSHDADGAMPSYGDRWTWNGALEDRVRAGTGFPGHPTYAFRPDPQSGKRLDRGEASLIVSYCLAMRRQCARILSLGLDDFPEHRGVLHALLLGYREALPEERAQQFARTGTLHVFAISGLHVGVMGTLLAGVLRIVGLSKQRWPWVLAPLLVGYAMATGLKPSAVRATTMALIVVLAPGLQRRPDLPSSLAGAAVLIVALRPGQLVAPGFLLSFAVVSGILLLHPVLTAPLRRFVAPDPWRLQPEPLPVRTGRAVGRRLLDLAALSLACWLAAAPLTATWFNTVSPVALPGNMVVVPGAFLVVLTACLGLLTGSWLPVLGEIFNHANRWFIDGLLLFVDGMDQWGFAYRLVPSPSPWGVAAWYGLIAVAVAALRKGRTLLAIPPALLLVFITATFPGAQPLRIAACETEGVVGVHVDARGRNHLVVDPGPMSWPWRRHLRAQGVNRIHALVLTGQEPWRQRGAEDLINDVPVDALWIPPAAELRNPWKHILRAAAARGVPVYSLVKGGGDLDAELGWDAWVSAITDNLVWLRVGQGDRPLLLLGTAPPTPIDGIPALFDGAAPPGMLVCAWRAEDLGWMPASWPTDLVVVAGGGCTRLEDGGSRVVRLERDTWWRARVDGDGKLVAETPRR